MLCPPSRPRGSSQPAIGRQEGAALVVAMLIFALSTALVVAMKSDFDRVFQRTAGILLAEQGQSYLRGAEDLAGLALVYDYDEDKQKGRARDDLQELWAQPAQPYPLDDGGWLRGSLEDLQGRFNLNLLSERVEGGPNKPRYSAAQAQFIRLLQALEEPEVSEYEAVAITEAISDWLDPDSIPSQEGAEDDYYSGATPAYRTGNRPMASVSELRSVANMTPAIYQALLPWVTVWPETPEAGSLNIHTAPLMVLRSLNTDRNLSPLSQSEGQSLVEYRESSGFEDVSDFLDNQVFAGKREQMTLTRGLLGQDSSYFLLRAEVQVADRNMRLYSVLERSNRRIDALVRASGSL